MRLIFLAPFVLLSGCAALGSHEFAHFNDDKGKPSGKIIIQPSSLHSLVVENGKVCAEPQPDASFKLGLSGSGEVSTPQNLVKAKGNGALSTGAINMGGRDSAVLFARDAAALLCFLSIDGSIDKASAAKLYEEYLKQSVAFAQAEAHIAKPPADDQSTHDLVEEQIVANTLDIPETPVAPVNAGQRVPTVAVGKPVVTKAKEAKEKAAKVVRAVVR